MVSRVDASECRRLWARANGVDCDLGPSLGDRASETKREGDRRGAGELAKGWTFEVHTREPTERASRRPEKKKRGIESGRS